MTFKALEVHLNGKKLYTVGHEDWHSLHAHVWGHRIKPETLTKENWPEGEPFPTEPIESVNLHCSFAIPGADSDTDGGRLSTESYDQHKLQVGDEITIKIVDTTDVDESNGPQQPNVAFRRQ